MENRIEKKLDLGVDCSQPFQDLPVEINLNGVLGFRKLREAMDRWRESHEDDVVVLPFFFFPEEVDCCING